MECVKCGEPVWENTKKHKNHWKLFCKQCQEEYDKNKYKRKK